MAVIAEKLTIGTDVHSLLRGLLERRSRGRDDHIMSLYVNLDPREFAGAAARSTEITSLLDQAAREAPSTEWNAVLDRLREIFANEDYAIEDAHGLGVFCSPDGEFIDLVRLPRPVQRNVVFEQTPHIRPLIEVLPRVSWAVALVNRRTARVLLGSRDGLNQVATIDDDVSGKHDQGGWSQANFQRSIEKEAIDHLKHVAAELFELHRQQPFDRLLIAAPPEARPMLERELHPYLAEKFVGWVDIDVEHTTGKQVHEAASAVIEQHEREHQRELLARLREGAGRNGRVALGLDAVLAALNEQRVDTLLIAEGYSEPGRVCPRCGWKTVGEPTCPVDGTALEPHHDIVECAVEAAVLQSAHVLTIGRDGAEAGAGIAGDAENVAASGEPAPRTEFLEMEGYGSIAALLRF